MRPGAADRGRGAGAGRGLAWPSPGSLALLGLSLALAWLLNLAVHVAIGCLAFWVTESTALFEVWLGLYLVLSGAAVPTSLYPAGLAEVVRALPFHASLGFPVELAIGRATGAEVTHGLLLQVLWVAGFGSLAAVLWRRGVRAYEGSGVSLSFATCLEAQAREARA
ncbi:ABC-2 family transporter protein [Nannocystis pusilla]|uniref:ABC-2 family transporter protein n=1 Tax=Nannocystis pusilla TaxID=889268 RepID=UPI003B7B3347